MNRGLDTGLFRGTQTGLLRGTLKGCHSGLNPRIPKKFPYRRRITIDHTQCGSVDSTNYPVLVSLNSKRFATTVNGGNVFNSNGYDIMFFSDLACTVPLSWEIDYFDGLGIAIFWVKLATLSTTVDNVIYMKYGQPTITTFQGGATGAAWNSNFQSVWHYANGTTLSALDSTANAKNGTISGPVATTGIIDGGAVFGGGSTDLISHGTQIFNSNPLGVGSISCWMYPTSNGVDGANGWNSTGIIANSNIYWGILFTSGNVIRVFANYDSNPFHQINGTTAIALNTWTKVDITWDTTTTQIYINGAADSTSGTGSMYNVVSGHVGQTTVIGHGDSGVSTNYFKGRLDEFRTSTVQLSASWITADFNSQKQNSTFLTISPEF